MEPQLLYGIIGILTGAMLLTYLTRSDYTDSPFGREERLRRKKKKHRSAPQIAVSDTNSADE